MVGYLVLDISSTNIYWITISLTFDQNFIYLIPISIILVPAFFITILWCCFFDILLTKVKKPCK